MAHLIHIAPQSSLKGILRDGIAPRRWAPAPLDDPQVDRVVWVFPVLPSYTLTHSWARELKRFGATTVVAVTVRIGDDEVVYARHYGAEPRRMQLAEAVGMIRSTADPRGYEIMIPRRIRPREIVRARVLNKAFGWRYAPNLKGRPPILCDCPVCLPRGEVKAGRQRERLWARMRAAGLTPDNVRAQRRRQGR